MKYISVKDLNQAFEENSFLEKKPESYVRILGVSDE